MVVFFDSDVIISGSFSQTGASHVLLQLAEVGIIQGVISSQVKKECRRNIRNKLPSALPAFEGFMAKDIFHCVNPSKTLLAKVNQAADPKDVPILAAAVTAKADVLTTFNIKDYFPAADMISVLTPGELLIKIQRDQE